MASGSIRGDRDTCGASLVTPEGDVVEVVEAILVLVYCSCSDRTNHTVDYCWDLHGKPYEIAKLVSY